MKVRTALSRPCPAGQTDNGQSFFENPDKIRTADRIETGKIRTDRHRTGFFTKFRTKSGQRTESRQTESGQTDIGQPIFLKSRQQAETGHDFPEKPEKTRQGQDTDSAVRRRLLQIRVQFKTSFLRKN